MSGTLVPFRDGCRAAPNALHLSRSSPAPPYPARFHLNRVRWREIWRNLIDMLEALDRKRGKGPQVVRVERVVVNEGGQAIVGNVRSTVSEVGEGQG